MHERERPGQKSQASLDSFDLFSLQVGFLLVPGRHFLSCCFSVTVNLSASPVNRGFSQGPTVYPLLFPRLISSPRRW